MTERSAGSTYDVVLVGVGGQGVLTIGRLMAEAALDADLGVNFYPTKGMAQRGGGVKVQVRIGRGIVGPQIPEGRADLVVAMERSEALKGVTCVRPGGEFLLYGHVWEPTQVMLGKADYPAEEQVRELILAAGARLRYLDPDGLHSCDGARMPANIYVLGAAVGGTDLGRVLDPEAVLDLVRRRWERHAALNEAAFGAGLEAMSHGP